MENYIVINGKKAELTEEQLEKLGIKLEKNIEDLFERKNEERYYYIDSEGCTVADSDNSWGIDEDRFNVGNYCTDEEVMEQRALHETLDRLLWRASVIAGELDNEWDGNIRHFYIYYDSNGNEFEVYQSSNVMRRLMVHFPTEESAKEAIENIVKPFTKEHPDFVW